MSRPVSMHQVAYMASKPKEDQIETKLGPNWIEQKFPNKKQGLMTEHGR